MRSPYRSVPCEWKECMCVNPAFIKPRQPKPWICSDHRRIIRAREKAAALKAMKPKQGPCIQCGENTGQTDSDGRWFHRKHVAHIDITKAKALEDQALLEKIAGDITTIPERELAIDRWQRHAALETYGGESYFPPLLVWRKQG